jgi:ubiquitin C-terminal hydrolase
MIRMFSPLLILKELNRVDFMSTKKNSSPVSFPVEDLNLSQFLSRTLTSDADDSLGSSYNLIGVINKIGKNVDNGHYTAKVKYGDDRKWYLKDDERARKIKESDVQSNDAYILVFEKNGHE